VCTGPAARQAAAGGQPAEQAGTDVRQAERDRVLAGVEEHQATRYPAQAIQGKQHDQGERADGERGQAGAPEVGHEVGELTDRVARPLGEAEQLRQLAQHD
jgi:hypothetical protein